MPSWKEVAEADAVFLKNKLLSIDVDSDDRVVIEQAILFKNPTIAEALFAPAPQLSEAKKGKALADICDEWMFLNGYTTRLRSEA